MMVYECTTKQIHRDAAVSNFCNSTMAASAAGDTLKNAMNGPLPMVKHGETSNRFSTQRQESEVNHIRSSGLQLPARKEHV